jgi:hypothetical protein
METTSSPWLPLSLFLSVASVVLATIAYWRSGGQGDVDAVRDGHEVMIDELRRATRRRFEECLARVTRADRRLAALRIDAAAVVHDAIDAVARELGEMKHDAEIALADLDAGVTRGAPAAQEALAKRVLYIEGSIRVLTARAEIRAAERLADRGKFAPAEDMLEDAIAKVREARLRLDDETAQPAFGPVIETLHQAIRSVRTRAADHSRQIDSALSASDSLLASLRSHERFEGHTTLANEA